ncbi:hypothetical protein Cgig2_014145 [Carnegiea gigantea]|uniref:ZF-HD dimerization-type domain-containing protein n=1 Tax=Carnegiea gigantea TaxID=171969 RepID=A0A9Q1GU92_9CARY|nr:hypothetical protein Cgig2_014145 [Carnegiea gigantea]
MMEFEEDHDGEEEEEEDEEEDEEMAITPTFKASTNDGKRPGPIGSCRYRECLKNHAIGIGGHAVDGCGEFMPAGAEGTLDALKCAACNCHRNFHRKEIVLDSSGTSPHHHHHHQNHQLALYTPRPQYHPHPHPHPQQPQVYQFYPYNRTSAANPTPTAAAFLQPRPLSLPSPSTGGAQTQTQTQEQQEDLMVMMVCSDVIYPAAADDDDEKEGKNAVGRFVLDPTLISSFAQFVWVGFNLAWHDIRLIFN